MSLIHPTHARRLHWPGGRAHRRLPAPPKVSTSGNDALLRVEEYRDGDHLVVRAEIPGMDPDHDVEITLSDRMLHLRAERRSESRTEEKWGYRSEFHYGGFSRAITLPAGATKEDVTASYDNGVLEIRVPIDTTAAQAQKIPVSRPQSHSD